MGTVHTIFRHRKTRNRIAERKAADAAYSASFSEEKEGQEQPSAAAAAPQASSPAPQKRR